MSRRKTPEQIISKLREVEVALVEGNTVRQIYLPSWSNVYVRPSRATAAGVKYMAA